MKVELINVDRVIPYVRNPRRNENAISKVAASIKEYGFRQPIVVDEEMVIIAGHTRLMAAQSLGLKKVPIHIATGLSAAQVKAYRLADNRTAQEAEWDEELLAIELGELETLDFDLLLTGFDAIELDDLMLGENDGLTDDDEIPEVPENAVSKEGDIWILGNHKLLCGDSTKAESVKALMGDELADMIFTDPPYNVNYGSSSTIKTRKIKNDNLGNDFEKFLTSACTEMVKVCKGAIYICMSDKELHTLHKSFEEAGGYFSTYIMWVKNRFVLGRRDYHSQYEAILYGWAEDQKHYWCGDRNQSDIWNYNRPNVNDLHPTMKPVELVCRAIENSSKSRDIVLDSFGGSGTTLIACEKLNRSARMIELDPKYCDVIIKRWQEFTGNEAVFADGKTFNQLLEKT